MAAPLGRQRCLALSVVIFLASPAGLLASDAGRLEIPWSQASFLPEEGCHWQTLAREATLSRANAHYIGAPAPGESWETWLARLRAYREHVRSRLRDASQAAIALEFDGVRAWIRTARTWAYASDLKPEETLVVKGQARSIGGNNRLCLAFDWCDREQKAEGLWRGWSTVIASTAVPQDGNWHEFQITARVPPFAHAKHWARPILGMDGTFDAKRGTMHVRGVSMSVPEEPSRVASWETLQGQLPRRAGFDDAVYRREDLKWMTTNFVCGFLMMYDRNLWDPEKGQYRVASLCDEAKREFGGYDSVVLWHAYPRIGADARNQFDFFRDMPGGLKGLRDVARAFHERGIKVFLPYNPWDTGTAREKDPDDLALAHAVAEMEADGIFLDTMIAAPTLLRESVDALRRGVVFEPEGHPSIEEMERCNGSWAQWLGAYPEIGVLHLKWLEPRHMQHQIRRWDKSHQDELAAAWLNGSGVLVWENVFGAWNPWNAHDRATLRRMAPVLRNFAHFFSEGEWLPYFPTKIDKVYASCWKKDGVSLWTIINQSGRNVEGSVLELDDHLADFYDLWNAGRIEPAKAGGKIRLSVPLERFGAIVAIPKSDRKESATASGATAGLPSFAATAKIEALVKRQKEQSRPIPKPEGDVHVQARPVVEPKAPPACPALNASAAMGMLAVAGGRTTFTVKHMRRECGCYPDPGTPRDQWERFLTGNPHDQTLEHRVSVDLAPSYVAPRPVTNAEFEAFLKATGYRPRSADKFLHHWGGPNCPAELRDQPVVYVDLDDARAYAAWSKRRLPTEWEWQQAAQRHGDKFQRAEVFEWTESERDDGHTRFVMLRGGSRYKAEGSIWYFPGGPQPVESHAKFLLMAPGLDRCATIGFRCAAPAK